MPKVANGINMEWNLRRARAENIELQWNGTIFARRKTILRALSYLNHANMGSYREAIDAFLRGQDSIPDIEAHRRQGRRKYGFGLNAEQQLTDALQVYSRVGWNEGHNESFAYTEVNTTAAIGGDIQGRRWHRPFDKLGLTIVSNGISGDHRRYLQLGGKGFLLGDGTLTYGREDIFESYYTAHAYRGISISADIQHIAHPGFNRDRGPVWIPGARLHFEF
jgi:high affinity Mn2+ porin